MPSPKLAFFAYTSLRSHPKRIACRKPNGGITGTQQAEQRVHKNPAAHGIEQRDSNRSIKAECAHTLCLLPFLHAKKSGDQAAAAHPEKVGQGGHHKNQNIGQGRSRNLVRVVCLAYEIGIGQIVDHGDELADDGRHRQRGQRFGDRRLFKQLLVFTHPACTPGLFDCICILQRHLQQAIKFILLCFCHAPQENFFGLPGCFFQVVFQFHSFPCRGNENLSPILFICGSGDE